MVACHSERGNQQLGVLHRILIRFLLAIELADSLSRSHGDDG
jgi:hypothetical protein